MRRAVVIGLGLSAVVVAGVSTAPAADNAANQQKIAELQKQLDGIRQQMAQQVGGPGGRGGRGDRGGQGDRGNVRELFQKAQELEVEITTLKMDPADAEKYRQYRVHEAEIRTKMRELFSDNSLDREARTNQMDELRKQSDALRTRYADVVNKADQISRSARESRDVARRTERLKDALKASDDEWTVLEPLIANVNRIRNELDRVRTGDQPGAAMRGMFGAFGGGRGRGGQSDTPEAQLRDVLQKEDATQADVQAKLQAVLKDRAEKAKKAETLEKELKAARDKLRELLTIHQEAVLVSQNVL